MYHIRPAVRYFGLCGRYTVAKTRAVMKTEATRCLVELDHFFALLDKSPALTSALEKCKMGD